MDIYSEFFIGNNFIFTENLGLNHRPSLKWMEANRKTWRKGSNTLAQKVKRRKDVVKIIQEYSKLKNISFYDASVALEQLRKIKNISLSQFGKSFKIEQNL